MDLSNTLRRALVLVLTLALAAAVALPGLAAYEMPIQTVNPEVSVYLFELDTGKVILEQNADVRRPIASLTKMMTGLLLRESGLDMEAPVTVSDQLSKEFAQIRAQNGSGVDLRLGEHLRRLDLLYALLLPSANDAAAVIAMDVSGTVPEFVAAMNARAAALGCNDTAFSCPHGLYDDGNYSTAKDLAKIALACYADPTYREITRLVTYDLPATNFHNARKILSTNLMQDPASPYYRDYIQGLKTGFTTKAGRCFVTFAEKDGHTYGLVLLGSTLETIYVECGQLLDWVFENFSDRVLVSPETPLVQVPLKGSHEADTLTLYAAAPVAGYGHRDDPVSLEYQLPEMVRAGVQEGQVIGTATVTLNGVAIGEVELVSHDTYVSAFRTDLRYLCRLLPVLLLALMLLIFLTALVGGNRKRRISRRQRRRRPLHRK